MNVTLERPKNTETVIPDKPQSQLSGGFGNRFGNRKPPDKITKLGYARDPDEEPDADETDSWAALGVKNPFE
jgi:hypothetical protein